MGPLDCRWGLLLRLQGFWVLALVVRGERRGDLSGVVGQGALAEAAPDEGQLADDDREGLAPGARVR